MIDTEITEIYYEKENLGTDELFYNFIVLQPSPNLNIESYFAKLS